MSSLCLSFFMLKLGCLWATFLYYLSLQNGSNSPHLHLTCWDFSESPWPHSPVSFKFLLHGVRDCPTYSSLPTPGVLTLPHLARIQPFLLHSLKQHLDKDNLCSRFLLNVLVMEEEYRIVLKPTLFWINTRYYTVSKVSKPVLPRKYLTSGQ